MTPAQLAVVLMALLPKEGSPRSVPWFCDLALVSREEVLAALATPTMRRVSHDVDIDALHLCREDA